MLFERPVDTEYNLPEPTFTEIGDTFRANLYRYPRPIKVDEMTDMTDMTDKVTDMTDKESNERKQIIISYLQKNGSISNKEARQLLSISEATAKRLLLSMTENGEIQMQGMNKARKYTLPYN